MEVQGGHCASFRDWGHNQLYSPLYGSTQNLPNFLSRSINKAWIERPLMSTARERNRKSQRHWTSTTSSSSCCCDPETRGALVPQPPTRRRRRDLSSCGLWSDLRRRLVGGVREREGKGRRQWRTALPGGQSIWVRMGSLPCTPTPKIAAIKGWGREHGPGGEKGQRGDQRATKQCLAAKRGVWGNDAI
jgi:hypothetical protein